MPEGPEVEAARTSVEKYSLGASVKHVEIVEQGGGPRDGLIDDRVCQVTGADVASRMLGQTVQQVNRKGKHFWIELSSGSSVMFHLGMTGSIAFRNKKVPAYKAFKVSTSWPPKFTKFAISFSNGEALSFSDPRRLGRVRIISDPLAVPPISKLAPDPLIDGLSEVNFLNNLGKYSAPIKSILLDQEKLCCGIGNWVADEVLYQSSIHPETPCNVLAEQKSDVFLLMEKIRTVFEEAVKANADDRAFPSDWLFHRRWNKGKGSSEALTLSGDAITFLTVGGRTSAVVLNRQQKLVKTLTKKTKAISNAKSPEPPPMKKKE